MKPFAIRSHQTRIFGASLFLPSSLSFLALGRSYQNGMESCFQLLYIKLFFLFGVTYQEIIWMEHIVPSLVICMVEDIHVLYVHYYTDPVVIL